MPRSSIRLLNAIFMIYVMNCNKFLIFRKHNNSPASVIHHADLRRHSPAFPRRLTIWNAFNRRIDLHELVVVYVGERNHEHFSRGIRTISWMFRFVSSLPSQARVRRIVCVRQTCAHKEGSFSLFLGTCNLGVPMTRRAQRAAWERKIAFIDILKIILFSYLLDLVV